ncbi:MAG: TonB-dependent receptor plug domain-containing protein [Mediterranea sp.]|jgi:TonB-dependent SusC/RagA subfamily outer membrane receptor|nr:TonB-dependent receptor plug domain-containing protein [Mediterranea sp.]
MTLEQAIRQIEANSDYRFIYKTEDVPTEKRDISAKGSIDEVLNTLLSGTGISHSVSGNKVMLKKVAPAPAAQQQKKKRVITGVVLDGSLNNEPVIGATVKLRNSSIGTATDVNGRYSITVEGDGGVLEFSYIGMKRQEVPIGNQSVINITLEPDSQTLDDVVVVGFGKQKKESVVGAVQTIKPAELRVPSSSLSTAFAGKLAGVVSVQRSGEPGADGASFWIRGISTFGGGSTPLIFIDGVEVSTGDLNALPPEVIESFSVLKDAAATALYGSRGASGVMLVTTRQGKNSERARINIRVEGQMTQPTKVIDLADGVDYMRMFNEAILTRNPSTSVANLPFSQSKIQHTAGGGTR